MRIPCILGILVLAAVIQTHAQIPEQLSYQGVLTDTLGNPRPDGVYAMTFRLFTVASGGVALWTETKNVTVNDGIFTTYLGDTTPFPITITWSTTYWLSVQVGAGPQLTPRIKMASVAYSLNPGGGDSNWEIDSANGYLYHGGSNVYIGRDFPISGNEAFGFRYSGGANEYGGMYAETEHPQGWPFYGFATNGSFRAWTYFQPDSSGSSGPGWKLYLSGIRLTVPPTGGLRIGPSADYSLVVENTTGSDGLRIYDTGDDAIQIGNNPDYSNYGVYIPSPGVATYGLWPNTAQAAGEWALFTVDKIEAGNVFSSAYTIIAKVTGPDPLTPGDVVAATGVADPIPGSQNDLSLVRLADETEYTGIVGVVASRMVWAVAPGKEAEGEMSMHSVDGPARPGDYVSLTVSGVAQVKINAADPITAGQRLTVAARGHARALRTRSIEGMTVAEGAPVVGVALSARTAAGTIPVHVNLR